MNDPKISSLGVHRFCRRNAQKSNATLKGSHTCDSRSILPDCSPEIQYCGAVGSRFLPFTGLASAGCHLTLPLQSLTRDKMLFFSLVFFCI